MSDPANEGHRQTDQQVRLRVKTLSEKDNGVENERELIPLLDLVCLYRCGQVLQERDNWCRCIFSACGRVSVLRGGGNVLGRRCQAHGWKVVQAMS